MADQSRLKIIKSNPIGTGLDDFRSYAVHQINLKNRAVDLIMVLQNLPAARSLPCIAGRGTLRHDLHKLEYSVDVSDDFDLESLIPLLDAVLSNESDELIWNKVYDAVNKLNTNIIEQSSERHELKEKMGPMYEVFAQALPPSRSPGQPPLVKRGGQGEVRLEIDTEGRKIAVKTIYYTNSKNVDKVIKDFQRECESLQSLPHPSIVRFLDFSHNPDMRQAVLRMEWAAFELSESGRADLGDIISSYKDKKSYHYLPEIFLWHVLFHLGAALALCHHGIELNRTQIPARVNSKDVLFQLIPNPSSQLISLARKNSQVTWTTEQIEFSIKDSHEPIIHRDIKPSNILLSDPPQDALDENWKLNSTVSLENDGIFCVYPTILLGDFGLSAPMKDAHTRGISTFEYCAPEVPREPSRPDSSEFGWTTKCDIFSLGATLWHLMSLQGPPERGHASDPQPSLPSNYSDGLRRLINKCCEWEALHRPTAIDILVACIEHSYWNETYVGPYGLPIAFDFTTTLWKSLQGCRQRIAPEYKPPVASMHGSSPFSHSLNLLSLNERTGKPLSIFVAGAYITQHFRYKPISYFFVPLQRTSRFVGRQDVLQLLHSRINSSSNGQVVISLCGMGGIGKTQIAIHFAHQVKERDTRISVFWVNGASLSAVEESYYRIAVECDICSSEQLDPLFMFRVKRWLESESAGRWLMIVDNVDDVNAFLETEDAAYIPKCTHGSILYTTRNLQFAKQVSPSNDIIHISEFTESEATYLLSQMISSATKLGSPHALARLSDELGYHPLAISQAAAFMNSYDLSVSDYFGYFTDQQTAGRLLKYETVDFTRDKGWESLYSTWKISFDRIQETLAADVLAVMSFLHPDTIPVFLLAQEFTDIISLDEAISTLRAMSLISPHNKGGAYAIHRITQLSMEYWLESQGSRQRFLSKCLHLLARLFPEDQDDNWKTSSVLLPHATRVLSLRRVSDENSLARAELLEKVSQYELKLGRLENTEQYAREALGIRSTLLGSIARETVKCQAHLARVLWALGKYQEARELAIEAFTTFKTRDPESPDTLGSMDILAVVLHSLGKYEEAEQMHRQALELMEEVLGKKHPSILASMNNLANVLDDQGKYKEAEQIHRQVLELKEEALGKEHPDTLASMNNLALVLNNQKKYKEAEEIYWATLKLRQEVLGKKHPDILASMNNLANVLDNQGKYKEAEQIHRQVLELMEEVLGKEHPDTLASMSNFANVLDNQGRHTEAEKIHRATLELKQKLLGRKHPNTLTSMNNLANMLYSLERYKEAEQMHQQALELMEEVLGKKHPDTLASMHNLAYVLNNQGKYKEAEKILRQILELMEEVLGKKHPDTLASMKNLAYVLEHQGKYEETGPNVTSFISKTIAVLETTAKDYSIVKDDKSLGEALHEAGRGLLLVEEALLTVHKQLVGRNLAGDPQTVMDSLKACNAKAKLFQSIFEDIAQAPETSRFERYRAVVQQECKEYTVEVLVTRMMNDVCDVAKDRAIEAAMKDQVKGLRDAIDKLSRIEPSIPNEGWGNTFSNYGPGNQFHAPIRTQNINTGSGKQFLGATFFGNW